MNAEIVEEQDTHLTIEMTDEEIEAALWEEEEKQRIMWQMMADQYID